MIEDCLYSILNFFANPTKYTQLLVSYHSYYLEPVYMKQGSPASGIPQFLHRKSTKWASPANRATVSPPVQLHNVYLASGQLIIA